MAVSYDLRWSRCRRRTCVRDAWLICLGAILASSVLWVGGGKPPPPVEQVRVLPPAPSRSPRPPVPAHEGAVEDFARSLLRTQTTQCNRTFFDILVDPVIHRPVRKEECPGGVLAAVSRGVAPRPTLPAKAAQSYFAPLDLPGCRLRWYTPEEACDVVSAQGNFLMIGDSLVRGITLGLLSILRNNYKFGGVAASAPHHYTAWKACECDGTWGGSGVCHTGPPMIVPWTSRAPQSSLFCPSWSGDHLHFNPAKGPHDSWYAKGRKFAYEELLETSGNGRVTIYVSEGVSWVPGTGLQGVPADAPMDELSKDAVFTAVFAPIFELAARYPGLRVIVGTSLAVKGDGRFPSQSERAINTYNEWVRKMVREHAHLGVELFDGRRLMEGLYTRDGFHYGSHDNVGLAQVLLNVLDSPPPPAASAPPSVQYPVGEGPPWAHGVPRQFVNPSPPENEKLTNWLGPGTDLRGCECRMDWEAWAGRNQSACYCMGNWCPSWVTPPWLTHAAAAGCAANGWDIEGVGAARSHTLCLLDCDPYRIRWAGFACGGHSTYCPTTNL